MKEFNKNKEGLFICEECGETFKICSSLSCHVGLSHNKKEYFDKWLKENHEGKCLHCEKETEYLNRWDRGYKQFCGKKCKKEYGMPEKAKKIMKVSVKKTCKEKYGCEAYTQTEEFKTKAKKTWNEKYGVDNPAKDLRMIKKVKQTKLKKYGSETYTNSNKAKQTCLKRYGVISPSHDSAIFQKQQINSFQSKKYKNTDLYYRASYEFDFLEKYYDKWDIKNGPSIRYKENKVYHPDFFIPTLNLIVEIKNSWLMKRDKESIEAKEKATIASGFKYCLIVDKNYTIFNKLTT